MVKLNQKEAAPKETAFQFLALKAWNFRLDPPAGTGRAIIWDSGNQLASSLPLQELLRLSAGLPADFLHLQLSINGCEFISLRFNHLDFCNSMFRLSAGMYLYAQDPCSGGRVLRFRPIAHRFRSFGRTLAIRRHAISRHLAPMLPRVPGKPEFENAPNVDSQVYSSLRNLHDECIRVRKLEIAPRDIIDLCDITDANDKIRLAYRMEVGDIYVMTLQWGPRASIGGGRISNSRMRHDSFCAPRTAYRFLRSRPSGSEIFRATRFIWYRRCIKQGKLTMFPLQEPFRNLDRR